MVTSTGFEPVNAAVKGRCVKPLHQLARATAHVYYHNGIRKTTEKTEKFHHNILVFPASISERSRTAQNRRADTGAGL